MSEYKEPEIIWPFLPRIKSVIEESWLTGRAEKVFTVEECKKIIEIGKSIGLIPSKFGSDVTDPKVRDSYVSWINPSEETNWIFERLEDTIGLVNEALFRYDLIGFVDGIQFTEYKEPGGHYASHIDRLNAGQAVRKLSCTIQLSDPADYDGGELEILTSLEKTEKAPKEQGTAFFFNSYLLHRVHPVTRGTRYAMVIWVTGPRFR